MSYPTLKYDKEQSTLEENFERQQPWYKLPILAVMVSGKWYSLEKQDSFQMMGPECSVIQMVGSKCTVFRWMVLNVRYSDSNVPEVNFVGVLSDNLQLDVLGFASSSLQHKK